MLLCTRHSLIPISIYPYFSCYLIEALKEVTYIRTYNKAKTKFEHKRRPRTMVDPLCSLSHSKSAYYLRKDKITKHKVDNEPMCTNFGTFQDSNSWGWEPIASFVNLGGGHFYILFVGWATEFLLLLCTRWIVLWIPCYDSWQWSFSFAQKTTQGYFLTNTNEANNSHGFCFPTSTIQGATKIMFFNMNFYSL